MQGSPFRRIRPRSWWQRSTNSSGRYVVAMREPWPSVGVLVELIVLFKLTNWSILLSSVVLR